MKKMKTLKTLLTLLVIANLSYSQNCYFKLSDATGMDMSQYQSDLETKACELQQSFPSEYHSQFKVFDMGFYSMNEYMQGGFQAIWDKVIDEKVNSQYYLVFGRQLHDSKGVSKLWVSMKLPSIVGSSCNDKEEYIINKLNEEFNPMDSPFDFAQSEMDAMQLIITLKSCEICDNEIDDDGDGLIDCEDIDCIVHEFSNLKGNNNPTKRSTNCTVPTSEQIDCILEHHEYLNQIQIYDSETGYDFCDELGDLLNAPTEEPDEIYNGIEIVDIYVPMTEIEPGDLIAFTKYRFPHNPPSSPAPDLDYGTDGDSSVISKLNKGLLGWTNQQLENRMTELLHFASNSQYEPVSDNYMNKFEAGSGGFYSEDDISELIKQTIEVKNKAKQFGKDLETRLQNVNGDITQLSSKQLDRSLRYVFSASNGYMFVGPTILINDISQVKYHVQDYSIDSLGNWQGSFYTEVIDHFGLDDDDPNNKLKKIFTYQFLHNGFAAWWILQHQRAYVPFRTKLRFVISLKGKINL